MEKILKQILEELTTVKSDISEIKTEVKEIRVDVDVLKTEVKEIRVDVDILKTEVKGIRSDVDVLKTEVKEIRIDVDILKDDAVQLKVGQKRIEEKLNSTHDQVIKNTEKIQETNTKLDTMSNDIDYIAHKESLNEKELFIIRNHIKKAK
ncbi:MAG: hypothetical protein MJA82_17580 [Clostridia bacterium]|nr:hypothetical protein [Clostridia bacterium]